MGPVVRQPTRNPSRGMPPKCIGPLRPPAQISVLALGERLCQHPANRRCRGDGRMNDTANKGANSNEQRMLPTDRIAYSAIAERPALKLPGGARMAIWVIVNVEEWDPKDTMPRTVLTPPAGGAPTPDIPNWCWHEYGNRVGFWRMLKVFDEFAHSRRAGDQRLRHRGVSADRQGRDRAQVGVHRPRLHPAQHAEGAGREGRHPHDHGGDQEGDRQAAARLARPGPHRDLADAGPAQGGRLRLRRRLGAGRPAGVAEDPRQADRQHPLHPGMQRRGDDADPASQGVGVLRPRHRPVRADLRRCRRTARG